MLHLIFGAALPALALLAVAAACTLKEPAIRGAVSFYGPFALEWGWDQRCRVLDVKCSTATICPRSWGKRGGPTTWCWCPGRPMLQMWPSAAPPARLRPGLRNASCGR